MIATRDGDGYGLYKRGVARDPGCNGSRLAGLHGRAAFADWGDRRVDATALERSTIRKIYWRLLPLAIVTYLLC
jgi:hypothetical protein